MQLGSTPTLGFTWVGWGAPMPQGASAQVLGDTHMPRSTQVGLGYTRTPGSILMG